MIKMIIATSINNVIGVNNSLPWKNSLDLKRFAKLTQNSTVLMGRNTWESIPKKSGVEPLKGRRKVVLTSKFIDGYPMINQFHRIQDALDYSGNDLWVIGGSSVYSYFLQNMLVDYIDLTVFPCIINDNNALYFNIFSFLNDKYIIENGIHDDTLLTNIVIFKSKF